MRRSSPVFAVFAVSWRCSGPNVDTHALVVAIFGSVVERHGVEVFDTGPDRYDIVALDLLPLQLVGGALLCSDAGICTSVLPM